MADEKKEGPHGSSNKSKWDIEVIETDKSKTPQRQCSKDGVMPKFPFSMMISGSSGSGKTNLLMNIMTRDDLYGHYFHYIVVFSPTAGSTDDMYKKLKIPEANFIREMKSEMLTNLIANRKARIEEKGIVWVAKNERMCIIMDDVIAERSFLESPDALRMFALLRHYLCAIIVLVQSYNKLPRSLRLNANAVMVFPAQQSEVAVLLDEITPAGLKKKEFENVIDHATSEPFCFLYINRHAKPGQQIRKNLDGIINIADFKQVKYTKAGTKDVTTDRGHVEQSSGVREDQGTGGKNLKSGYPRDEAATGVPTEPGNARQLLQRPPKQQFSAFHY
jgi:hypothetical protein